MLGSRRRAGANVTPPPAEQATQAHDEADELELELAHSGGADLGREVGLQDAADGIHRVLDEGLDRRRWRVLQGLEHRREVTAAEALERRSSSDAQARSRARWRPDRSGP
jgi:hypothetical protein